METQGKYRKKVVNEYKMFITPLVGNGDIRKVLLDGLEKIIKDNQTGFNPCTERKDNLDKPIDYDEISILGRGLTRIMRFAFQRKEIHTYGELIEFMDGFVERGCSYRDALSSMMGMGKTRVNVVLTHLKVKGFIEDKNY